MIFEKILIQNFFRYTNPEWIELANQGLVLINGSNGSGKSTIFEALVWAIWGKTTRGKTGDDVVNRVVGKDCYVELVISDGDQTFRITRYRKHKHGKNRLEFGVDTDQGPVPLTQGTTAQTQEAINELLGIDFDTFIRGPMLPQGSIKKFSQLSDSEVKTILESALQLEVLAKAHTIAKDKLQEVTQGLTQRQGKIDTLEAQLERCYEEKKRAENQAQIWLSEQHSRLRAAAGAIFHAQERLDDLWETIEPSMDVQSATVVRDEVIRLGGQKLKGQSTRVNKIQTALSAQHSVVSVAKANCDRIKLEIKSLRDMEVGSNCPTCRQEISEEHLEDCVAPLEQLLEYAKTEHKEARIVEDQLRNKSATLDAEYSEMFNKVQEFRKRAEQRVVDATRQSQKQEQIEDALELAHENLRDARYKLEQEKEALRIGNPALEALEVVKNDTQKFTTQRDELNSEIETLSVRHDHLKFWVDGFSNAGLKSYILSTVTPYMNHRAAVYSQDLTNGEIKIKFHTQVQLKSKEWREKFYVEVNNENGSEDYEGNSGGEKAKADLAINFTLSDVVASRAKKAYPQRWFDEPFESLDEAGVEAVMELLTNMVQECGTIFVVTHHPGLQTLFNKTINVSKVNGETRLSA